MTLPRDLQEIWDWLVAHRRDPFFWGIAVLLLILAGGQVLTERVLPKVLGFQEAANSLKSELGLETITVGGMSSPCTIHGMKAYGFTFLASFGSGKENDVTGKMCWDIFKSRWEWEFPGSFSRFNSNPAR